MADAFSTHYAALMAAPKQAVSFIPVFGRSPAQWYRAFQRDASTFHDDGTVKVPDGMDRHCLFERSKGSVFHFLRYFPDDPLLGRWAQNLGEAMNARAGQCDRYPEGLPPPHGGWNSDVRVQREAEMAD
jgi:hypothetical protein